MVLNKVHNNANKIKLCSHNTMRWQIEFTTVPVRCDIEYQSRNSHTATSKQKRIELPVNEISNGLKFTTTLSPTINSLSYDQLTLIKQRSGCVPAYRTVFFSLLFLICLPSFTIRLMISTNIFFGLFSEEFHSFRLHFMQSMMTIQ